MWLIQVPKKVCLRVVDFKNIPIYLLMNMVLEWFSNWQFLVIVTVGQAIRAWLIKPVVNTGQTKVHYNID